ncbi:MAG: leucyl aminopeptidase [Rickettsiaceae bacterium]|nr:leucyl aminopeptidase [Rickettsiaceae bacterium]MDP4832428.1 leucyl aminopeptidase [Rickettsiaceae bacterium]MDP5020157.1 leucyl aminopeptidase [Rickettsiaceae bacterium]MDP5082745.1 leucyl aminopeptidase [Rickettsiaceae bacterium]
MLNISFEEKNLYDNEAIAVLVNDQLKIDGDVMTLDQKHHGLISKTIQNANKFKGTVGQTLSLTTTDKDGTLRNIIIVGIGDESKLEAYQLEEVGGKIYSAAKASKSLNVGINALSRIGSFEPTEVASLLASGGFLAAYSFNKYLTKRKEEEKFVTETFNVIVAEEQAAYDAFAVKKAIAMGVYFARDLVSEVPNILYPESYAEQIVEKLEPLGVDVEVLGEREMRNLGMGALLGVGQGSANESKLVIMKYEGGAVDQKPVCFVGKGVTFDTGGISIKPAAGMGDMKYDMGGSAAVVGAMKALALRSAKVNAVGIVGLVENMPGSNAQRPGDVVTSMSGQTIEVLNTDAEGRLVLCDCVTYLQENFDPDCIIDLATLTGAILIALANTYAGCFANDDELANKLIASGNSVNEKLWRMPLHKDFDEMLKSPIADIANIGGERGMAGSSTAAHFIGRFIKEGVRWAHLDIAGTAWEKKGKNPICPIGGVGFGVRLLDQFVQDNYESK